MELAGVVNMGISQEGISPDLLKYIFLKGYKGPEQQPENAAFWVFNRSHEIMIPATASAERNDQATEAVPDQITIERSARKQTTITDFFSPRLPTSESECVIGNYLDFTRPMFECQVSKPSSESSFMEPDSLPAQIGLNTPSPKVQQANTQKGLHPKKIGIEPYSHHKAIDYLKLSRRYSLPNPVTIWQTHSTSDYSNDATELNSSAQGSDPSSPTSPTICSELTPETSLSPSTTESIGTSQTEYTKTSEAKRDVEEFWIEKDNERLEVIASVEKTMTEVQRKLDTIASVAKDRDVQQSLDKDAIAFIECMHSLNTLPQEATVEESKDSHPLTGERATQAPKIDNVALPSTNEDGVFNEPFEDEEGTEVGHDKVEEGAAILKQKCSTDMPFEEKPSTVMEASSGAVFIGNGAGASDETIYPEPALKSKPAEATDSSISNGGNDSNAGKPFAFGVDKNPPTSLFATTGADSKLKPGERNKTSGLLQTLKPAAAINPSTKGKDNRSNIWNDDDSATTENKPFLFKAIPAADLEETSKEKTPIFKSFSTSQTAEANTAFSKTPATPAKKSEPTRNQKRAAKKQQQKADKKAEKEARNAKAEARRRVQQALMMK